MQSNKLRMAIRATASALILGVAGQAGAVDFEAGDYDVSVYGYARFNASYDIDENIGISTRSGAFSAINKGAAEDNEVTGHFAADAFQTRLGVRTMTPEGVKVVVEGDFRGGGGGVLRLRHGYGEYKGVLLGQTWSNFSSFVGNTSTLDFDSLAGVSGLQGRVPQARYTTGPLSFSLENNLSFTQNSGGTDKAGLPTATARLEDSSGILSYSAALAAQQIAVDNGTTVDETALGFATFVAAKVALTDMISVQGNFTYTDGGNAYLYRSGDNFAAADAYIASNGDLETIEGYGGSLGVGFDLGGGRNINVGYGLVTVDLDDAANDGVAVGGETETNQNLMANYQWSPVNNVTMGVEYAYFKSENQNGDDGDASRILFAGQYNF